ncbi:MAG: hypothetical protein WED09_01835 [Homoserinimonas sp.]
MAVGLVAFMIAGCGQAPIPDDAWVVSPIRYDNALNGDRESFIDVTYSMGNFTGDTEGGFWTESAGSWLHIDRHGQAVSRFNDFRWSEVQGLAALSPSVLVVSGMGGGRPDGLYTFNTDEGTSTRVDVSATAIGDVVSLSDGRLVFVDYHQVAPPQGMPSELGQFRVPYSILSLDPAGMQSIVVGPDEGLAASDVALDATPDGAIYVSTDAEDFTIEEDGTRSRPAPHQLGHPVVAVAPSGALLSIAPVEHVAADAAWLVDSGSAEAQAVIEEKGVCQSGSGPPLAVKMDGEATTLPFSCGTRGAVWLTDTSFVLSTGDESGTVLAKVTFPRRDRRNER